MFIARFSLWGICLLALTGCGEQPVPVAPPDNTTQIRQSLSDIEKTGQLGSGLDLIAEQIDALKESDPEKAAKLEEAFEKLSNSSNPREAKKQATTMIEML